MIDKQAIREYLTTLVDRDVRIEDDASLLATRLLDSLKVAGLVVFL